MYNTRKKDYAMKHLRFFLLETLKNSILNEKFNPWITQIMAFFPNIGTLFSNFWKKARERSPPNLPPPTTTTPVLFFSYPPVLTKNELHRWISVSGQNLYWLVYKVFWWPHKFPIDIWYKFINFLLPLIPTIQRMGNSPKIIDPKSRWVSSPFYALLQAV